VRTIRSTIGGGASALVDVNTDSVVGIFHVGSTTIGSVFALTDDGTTLYALSGTEVYSVDLSDAALTPLFNYGGDGLAGARGAAFIGEGAAVVPESSTWAMLLFGFAGLGYAGYRKARIGPTRPSPPNDPNYYSTSERPPRGGLSV
jgi:hypothetical protein